MAKKDYKEGAFYCEIFDENKEQFNEMTKKGVPKVLCDVSFF